MVILTAFTFTLHLYSQEDLVTVPISGANRERPELNRVVGFLSEPKLITVDFSGQRSLDDYLRRVRNAVLSASEEQSFSMSHYYHSQRMDVRDIPFRISMNYLPAVDLPAKLGAAASGMFPRQTKHLSFRDFALFVRQWNGRIRLSFGYAQGVVDEKDMLAFARDMGTALRTLGHPQGHDSVLETAAQ